MKNIKSRKSKKLNKIFISVLFAILSIAGGLYGIGNYMQARAAGAPSVSAEGKRDVSYLDYQWSNSIIYVRGATRQTVALRISQYVTVSLARAVTFLCTQWVDSQQSE